MEQVHAVEETDSHKVPAYFCDALNDAERLLKYAAEIGVTVDTDTRAAVLHARAVYPDEWTEDIGANLLFALTKLAADLKPVTAESLKAYHTDTRPAVHNYLVWAIVLACIILPVSIATFVTSAISTALTADITKANGYAVKLRAELGPPSAPAARTGPRRSPLLVAASSSSPRATRRRWLTSSTRS